MHNITDRRTDRRTANANSRSYCVAVRSAKNGGVAVKFYKGVIPYATFMQLSSAARFIIQNLE